MPYQETIMPTYNYMCSRCDQIVELKHSIHDDTPKYCEKCQTTMERTITVPLYVISKEGGYANHKEEEHRKKVKDPERAVKMRKKAFGREAVGDPSMQTDPKHIIKKGRTLGGQDKTIDKKEFIKAAARDNYMVNLASDALKKKNRSGK
jgi:putative FmdB family regulatory protein